MTTKNVHQDNCEKSECNSNKCNSEACDCGAEAAVDVKLDSNEAEKPSLKGDKKLKHKHKEHELQEKLAAALSKANENYDLYLRNFAEFDNYRKRSAKEKENVYCDSMNEMVSVFLPIVDNFERALSVEVSSEDGVGLKAGLEMIFKQMMDTFQKLGVTEIETAGKEFDPALHEAVMHVEDDDFGQQEIIEVFQKGYIMKDKVIRHSMVKVAN